MSSWEKVLALLALITFVVSLNLWWWFMEYPHLINAGCHL